MTDLEESFAKLLGRQPSDKQRQDLYRVRDALELGSNDALWLVLMALQHYEDLYERVPAQIVEAATETLRGFQKAAETTAQAAAAETKRELVGAVAAAARDIAQHVEARQKLKWLCAVVAVCVVGVGGLVAWIDAKGREAGYSLGYGRGYGAARDERAAASWAATPEGQIAYQLAKAGSLRQLGSCSAPGWYIEQGVCYPARAADGLYGWRVDSRSRR
jgi:hypothetical protein